MARRIEDPFSPPKKKISIYAPYCNVRHIAAGEEDRRSPLLSLIQFSLHIAEV